MYRTPPLLSSFLMLPFLQLSHKYLKNILHFCDIFWGVKIAYEE